MCHHPSVSLNKEKVSREISETKIAVCEKTQGLRSGNFSDLSVFDSVSSVKIFQFQDMHYENRFLSTFQGHSKRPTGLYQAVCAIRPQSSMGAQFTNFARNVNSPSVMGKFSIYFILISSHFDYVLYYYIEKECLVLMCA